MAERRFVRVTIATPIGRRIVPALARPRLDSCPEEGVA